MSEQMPLHNLLRHVAGYVSRGCAACDWLLHHGYIQPEDCYESEGGRLAETGMLDPANQCGCGDCLLEVPLDPSETP